MFFLLSTRTNILHRSTRRRLKLPKMGQLQRTIVQGQANCCGTETHRHTHTHTIRPPLLVRSMSLSRRRWRPSSRQASSISIGPVLRLLRPLLPVQQGDYVWSPTRPSQRLGSGSSRAPAVTSGASASVNQELRVGRSAVPMSPAGGEAARGINPQPRPSWCVRCSFGSSAEFVPVKRLPPLRREMKETWKRCAHFWSATSPRARKSCRFFKQLYMILKNVGHSAFAAERWSCFFYL